MFDGTRLDVSFRSIGPMRYSLQVAATIFPDSTLNAGAAADGSLGSGVLVVSIVPTSSSFFPTCSLSAVGFAIRRNVCAVAASAGVADAPVRMNFDSAAPLVPVAPAVGGPAAAAGSVRWCRWCPRG